VGGVAQGFFQRVISFPEKYRQFLNSFEDLCENPGPRFPHRCG
jgi:hypothetical protein